MKKTERTQWKFGDALVPVTIHHEWRQHPRASLRKSGLIIRLPLIWNNQQKTTQINRFNEWAVTQLQNNKAFYSNFKLKTYRSGQKLQVGNRKYFLKIEYTDLKNHHASLEEGQVILLRLAEESNKAELNKIIQRLLSRLIASDFEEEIIRRVQYLNQKHIGMPLRKVRLKYNTSNWGSCSTKGNINLSTRLLFAPQLVIDYVIIHELAHLKEANHSSRFWKIVSDIIPEYQQHEQWLNQNWHRCDF